MPRLTPLRKKTFSKFESPVSGREAADDADRARHTRKRIKEVVRLFREELEMLKQSSQGERSFNLCLAAASLLKRLGISMDTQKRLGTIPGVEIGDKFQFRAEMKMIGLHCQYTAGVDFMVRREDGVRLATSIVASSRYSNFMKSSNVLIYSGHGGNPNVCSSRRMSSLQDQKLEGGNLALKNSLDARKPVRVIRSLSSSINNKGDEDEVTRSVFVYDGLYTVESMRQERGEFGKLVFKFELIRIPGQPPMLSSHPLAISIGAEKRVKKQPKKEKILVNDISEGKEGCCSNAIKIQFQFEVFRTWDFNNGWGLRSRQYIPSGSLICEYVGEFKQVRSKDGIRYQFDNDFSSGRGGFYTIIDATQYGNLGRFINRSSHPNLKAEKVNCVVCRVSRVLIYAAKDIPPRRELTLEI
ncbi:Histone-lysine N-methyltransferase, H3 lysine-9 specific SUVH5 [Linum perenne]